MTNINANHLKFPFIYAINEILELDNNKKDLKTFFIESTIRILAKGYSTDTNCSIGLGLVGAIIGYNNIPSYYKSMILNS